MNSSWLHKIYAFTGGWLIFLLLWRIIRKFGINVYLDLMHVENSTDNILLFIVTASVVAGIIFGSIQYLHETYFTRKISFVRLLITGVGIHSVVMLLLYLVAYIFARLSGMNSDWDFLEVITSPLLVVNFFYTILINIFIVVTLHINKLLGKGNLWKLLTGRFYQPKDEFRVFMFLDLKSSTSIAEKLGHTTYSRFIQDCFYDLQVIEKHKVEVYQYVGDEVVLTWKVKKETQLNDCLQAYFTYAHYLESRAAYYTSHYGVQPFFRAGMHVGWVTAVEVGKLKREIAYHGDTINIASRIQELCKTYEKNILISDAVLVQLNNTKDSHCNKMGDHILRGKNTSTSIYSVERPA